MSKFDPDVQLEHSDRAALIQVTAMEGYRVLHRLMRSEVDKFIVAMINADPSKREDVCARQVLAKAAAQFYEAITNRVNEEITQYVNAPRPGDKPIDSAAGLDLDTFAALTLLEEND